MASTTETLSRSTRIAKNQIRGVSSFTVIGSRYALPSMVDNFVWHGPNNEDYVFTDPSSARINRVSSDSTLDIGQQILVLGLDENWMEVEQTVTLNGQNKVNLNPELIRLNYAQALQNLNGDVYIYEDGTVTGGEPDDLSTVKGFIDRDFNKTLSTAYSIPNNKQANGMGLRFIGRPSVACCVELKPIFYPFNGAKTVFAPYPIVNNASTYLPLIPVTNQIIPPKTDTFVEAYPSSPNSGVTVIVELELYNV